jgi:hypothetical protein
MTILQVKIILMILWNKTVKHTQNDHPWNLKCVAVVDLRSLFFRGGFDEN